MNEELKRIIEYIEKNHPNYEINYVHSWKELGGNVDSCIFSTYEDAARVMSKNTYIKILPVIVER